MTWAAEDWVIVDGEALLSGLDLARLSPSRLYHALTALMIRYQGRDEYLNEGYKRVVPWLTSLSQDPEEVSDFEPAAPGLPAPLGVLKA